MLTVNSNISALNARTAISRVELRSQTAIERLSTGNQINSAADDAAGHAVGHAAVHAIEVPGVAVAVASVPATANVQTGVEARPHRGRGRGRQDRSLARGQVSGERRTRQSGQSGSREKNLFHESVLVIGVFIAPEPHCCAPDTRIRHRNEPNINR